MAMDQSDCLILCTCIIWGAVCTKIKFMASYILHAYAPYINDGSHILLYETPHI